MIFELFRPFSHVFPDVPGHCKFKVKTDSDKGPAATEVQLLGAAGNQRLDDFVGPKKGSVVAAAQSEKLWVKPRDPILDTLYRAKQTFIVVVCLFGVWGSDPLTLTVFLLDRNLF